MNLITDTATKGVQVSISMPKTGRAIKGRVRASLGVYTVQICQRSPARAWRKQPIPKNNHTHKPQKTPHAPADDTAIGIDAGQTDCPFRGCRSSFLGWGLAWG